MGKFDGVLICSDMDNTLALHGGNYYDLKFCPRDVEEIRYFQREGGRFTVISGRYPDKLRKLMTEIVPNAPIGGYNGALLQNADGTLFYEGGSEQTEMIRVAQCLWENHREIEAIGVHVSGHKILRCNRSVWESDMYQDPLAMLRDMPFRTYNVVVAGKPGEGERICRLVEQALDDSMVYTRPYESTVEFSLREDTKGAALLRIKKEVGAKLAVAVGDYENDIEMLRAADIGYAVENACEALHAVADRTAPACGKGAIAAIVAELETRDL